MDTIPAQGKKKKNSRAKMNRVEVMGGDDTVSSSSVGEPKENSANNRN